MRNSCLALVTMLLAACTGPAAPASTPSSPTKVPAVTTPSITALPATTSTSTTTSTTTTTLPATTTIPTTTSLPPGVIPPPAWLGTRVLPLDDDGQPIVPESPPPEMVDRRFATVDLLPPPDTTTFSATISPVPESVADSSTWEPGCPVEIEDLSYILMTFWGFDERPHTGEMIVNSEEAEDVVTVFEQLYEARFPIEQMRIATPADLEAEPTGDGNVTESFVCRPATGGTSWSQHAYGLAIDINPFHNPYLRGDVLIPELAVAYLDRDRLLPGMIIEGDVVTHAFDSIGWGWGGRWTSLADWQHFSRSGT